MPKQKRPIKAKPAVTEMSTGEATVAALIAHGLDTVYALPGVHNDHLFDAFHRASNQLKVIHTRHEQGAAYMALGAALATGKPQAYAVVPGPGLLNSGAALLTAYGMNAPVLALIGQIPHAAIGRGLGHLHEIRDQAGIIARLVDHSAHIRGPGEAPAKVAKAIASMHQGRYGPAALECAIDVWGERGPVAAILAPTPPRAARIDEDAVRKAAKLLAKAKRVLIVAGGGAQDASPEVTLLSGLLQAPVLAYRRGRGVLDGRDPFSVTLPLGRDLWGEADAVLAVGTRLLNPLTIWGTDKNLKIVRVDANREEPSRAHKPNVALIGEAAPILRRLIDELAKHNPRRPSRRDEMLQRQAKLRARLEKLAPQLAFVEAIRAELPEDGIYVDEVTQVGFVARLAMPVYKPRTFLSPGLSGQSRLGLRHRARRAAREARRAGALDQWRWRLSLYRQRDGHRHPPPHSARRRRVRGWRLRQCAAHPGGTLRRPADCVRPRQPRFRQICRKLRRGRPPGAKSGPVARGDQSRLCPARADFDRSAGGRAALALGIHPHAARAGTRMIPKSMSSTLIGDGYRFSEKDHAQEKS